jgi:uncharacterized protein (DUF2147 family)
MGGVTYVVDDDVAATILDGLYLARPKTRGHLAMRCAIHLSFDEDRRGEHRVWRVSRYAGLLAAALVLFALPHTATWADIPQGQWLMDGKVVAQTFDCGDKMCGRILWLKVPRNAQGQLDRDKKNPNPALRNRRLCGLTILWNLQPDGSDRWKDGWFYNPDDGKTYRVTARLKSNDEIVARIYVGLPLFGKTKVLTRVPHGTSAGWC